MDKGAEWIAESLLGHLCALRDVNRDTLEYSVSLRHITIGPDLLNGYYAVEQPPVHTIRRIHHHSRRRSLPLRPPPLLCRPH